MTYRATVDSMIAATARLHGPTVVTPNTADFRDCDVPLLDSWERPPSPPADS